MKKIMFNDKYGLTKAVLKGRKTITRRIAEKVLVEDIDQHLVWTGEFKKPKYKVGEVVAVAQSYGAIVDELEDPRNFTCMEHWESKSGDRGKYAELAMYSPGGNNKMFVCADEMPHQIRITNVRVERLQDISDEDCLREGIYKKTLCPPGDIDYFYHSEPRSKMEVYPSARDAFAGLIDKVFGKGTFESNPWVFVYEFELVK